MAIGLFCTAVVLATQGALVAKFVTESGEPNDNAFRATIAMIYVFSVVFTTFLEGSTFVYIGEI